MIIFKLTGKCGCSDPVLLRIEPKKVPIKKAAALAAAKPQLALARTDVFTVFRNDRLHRTGTRCGDSGCRLSHRLGGPRKAATLSLAE